MKKKEEREEKTKEVAGRRFPNFRDKRFGDKRDERNKESRNDKDNVKCYYCQSYGHISRNCNKLKFDSRRGVRH